jgi:hypothetical protein
MVIQPCLCRHGAILLFTLSSVGVSGFGGLGAAAEVAPRMKLITEPPLETVRSLQHPVTVTLVAQDAKGGTLNDARLRLQIFAPPTTAWFPSKSLEIEGTKLLNLDAITSNGQFRFRHIFPIPGHYQLRVQVTPIIPRQFAPFHQILTVKVPNHWAMYHNVSLLTIGLLVIGWIGGRVIRHWRLAGMGDHLQQNMGVMLSGLTGVVITGLLAVNVSAELSSAPDQMLEWQKAERPTLKAESVDLKLNGDRDATVGRLISLQIQATDLLTGQPARNQLFKITVTRLDNDQLAFAYQSLTDATGQLVWQQQFFAPGSYYVDAEAIPQQTPIVPAMPLKVSKTLQIKDLPQPMMTRFMPFMYTLYVLGTGIAGGFWQQQRKVTLPKLH